MPSAKYLFFDAFDRRLAVACWYQVPDGVQRHAWEPVLAAQIVREQYDEYRLDPWKVSEFAEAHLGPGIEVGNFDAAIDWVMEGILDRRMLVLPSQLLTGGEQGSGSDVLYSAARRFWSAFGNPFLFSGRTYRLVMSEIYAEAIRSGDFEAMRPQQAHEILGALARSKNAALDKTTWTRLESAISHPSQHPTGNALFLLQKVRAPSVEGASAEQAMTPAQLKKWVDERKQLEKGWVEIKVCDPHGRPISDCSVSGKDSDGAALSGTLDSAGFLRMEPVSKQGPVMIEFPQLPDRKGKQGPGTQGKGEPSDRKDGHDRLIVVAGGPPVTGLVNQQNLYCVYPPVMTIAFATHEPLDDMEHPQYVLRSTDGRYQKKRTPKDDLVPGDDLLQLEFDELLLDAVYDLERIDGCGRQSQVFLGRTFIEIVDQPRTEEFDRHHVAEGEQGLAAIDDAVGWIDTTGPVL